MRLMTDHTKTCRNNRMDILVGKDRPVVAAIAEVRKLCAKQSLEIRLMGLMTIHAHSAGHRRMLELKPHDLALTVAPEAYVWDLIPEQLSALPCMWVMAQQTLPVVNRSMHPEFSSKERFIVTDETELGSGLQEQFFHLSAVRIMARGAHASSHRRMDRMVLKHGLAVAAEAKVGHRQKKKARVIRVMHIVTGKAPAFGNRRVFDRMRKLCFVVAGEAEIRAGRK